MMMGLDQQTVVYMFNMSLFQVVHGCRSCSNFVRGVYLCCWPVLWQPPQLYECMAVLLPVYG